MTLSCHAAVLAAAGSLAWAAGPACAAPQTLVQSRDFSTRYVDGLNTQQILSGVPIAGGAVQYDAGFQHRDTLLFDGFDSALGTLTGVSLAFFSSLDYFQGFSVTVPEGSGGAAALHGAFPYFVQVNLGGRQVGDQPGFIGDDGHYCSANGASLFCAWQQQTVSAFDFGAQAEPDSLGAYTAQTVALDLSESIWHDGWALSSAPGAVLTTLSRLIWSGTATLTYEYEALGEPEPIPEPGSLALAFAGLVGLALARRRVNPA